MATLIDNFDSYTVGDLDGQGSWSGSLNWDVLTAEFQSSPNSAGNTTGGAGDISKDMTATGTGNQVFYMRSSALVLGVTNHNVRFFEGATFLFFVSLNEGGGSPGDIILEGSGSTIITTWVVNTWYKIEVEWKTSDDTVRARVDDGTWTAFVAVAAAFTNVDKVTLRATALGGSFYVDSFSDPNAGVVTPVASQVFQLMGVGT